MNELGFTVSCNPSRISDTAALVTVDIQNMPVNISVNNMSINRSATDTPDIIDLLHYEAFPSLNEFPMAYVDNGDVIIPGGGGATTSKPIDPTKTYVYSAQVTSQPLVVQEWGQGTLPPVGSPLPATIKKPTGKKK